MIRAQAPVQVEECREEDPMIRIAAVGDVHLDADVLGRFRPALEELPDCADVLLLAGDLTRHGTARRPAASPRSSAAWRCR